MQRSTAVLALAVSLLGLALLVNPAAGRSTMGTSAAPLPRSVSLAQNQIVPSGVRGWVSAPIDARGHEHVTVNAWANEDLSLKVTLLVRNDPSEPWCEIHRHRNSAQRVRGDLVMRGQLGESVVLGPLHYPEIAVAVTSGSSERLQRGINISAYLE